MFIRINLQSSVGRQCSCLKDAVAFKTFKFLWGLGIFSFRDAVYIFFVGDQVYQGLPDCLGLQRELGMKD